MDKRKELRGLELPRLEPEAAHMRGEMRARPTALYTVETAEGDLLTLTQEALERYAAREAAARTTQD